MEITLSHARPVGLFNPLVTRLVQRFLVNFTKTLVRCRGAVSHMVPLLWIPVCLYEGGGSRGTVGFFTCLESPLSHILCYLLIKHLSFFFESHHQIMHPCLEKKNQYLKIIKWKAWKICWWEWGPPKWWLGFWIIWILMSDYVRIYR